MYYPKSQILTNLYTKGNEYILSTTREDYTGFFYETSTGNKYTGKSPNNSPNILLLDSPIVLDPLIYTDENQQENSDLPIIQEFTNLSYSNPLFQKRSIPTTTPTPPTSQDKSLGIYTRYFCKKTNEAIFLEIDEKQYNQLTSQEDTIAWDLYNPGKITWLLMGNKEKVYNVNKSNVSLFETQNKWYGFTTWFREGFLKFYLAT